MRKRLQTLQTSIRSLGWVDGLAYLLGTAMSRLTAGTVRIVKYHLVVQPVTTEPMLPAHRGRSIKIHEAGCGDPFLQNVPGRREGIMDSRFGLGGRCLVATLRGELAGYLWYMTADYPEDEVRCLFRPTPRGRSAWDFDVYVAEKFRLSPVFPKLWQEANQQLYAEGMRWSCSRISAFNRASLGSHGKLGARRVGWVFFLVLGPWQFMCADRAPYLHLSFTDRSRPVLCIGPPEY